METIYLCIVIFLLCLAVFDLFVGVSNDAVNFLQSAVGARVASFRTILIIASVGVMLGAVMSSGMMDVARHGINAVMGGALGLVKGALLLFFAVWLLRRLQIWITPELISQTYILRFFAEHSPMELITSL